MPLTVITGLPGAGKSLWTLKHVSEYHAAELQQKRDRPVYYHGIPDLKLPWIHLEDPKAWHDCPTGAIIVIDEASDHFPVRKRDEVPPHVALLRKHRHKGFDIFLITQRPKELDIALRDMVDIHVHLKRKFRSSKVRVFEWNGEGVQDPNDYHAQQRAAKSWFKHPPEFFDKYKSADVHTIQARVPWFRLLLPVAGLGFVCVWAYFAFGRVGGQGDEEEEKTAQQLELSDASISKLTNAIAANLEARNPWKPELQRPRMEGVPASAPFYDDLVKPVAIRKVAGCSVMDYGRGHIECTCNDQQGNKLALKIDQCLDYHRNGWFDFTRPDRDEEPSGAAGAPANAGETDPGIPSVTQAASSVTSGIIG